MALASRIRAEEMKAAAEESDDSRTKSKGRSRKKPASRRSKRDFGTGQEYLDYLDAHGVL